MDYDFNVAPPIGINTCDTPIREDTCANINRGNASVNNVDSTPVKENDCVNVNMNNSFQKNCNLTDVCSELKSIRIKNLDRVIIATLNMERIRQEKFEQLKLIMDGNIDILVIT